MPRTSVKLGRIWLAVAFALLLVSDATMLHYARVPNHPVQNILVCVLIALIWTAIGAAALWMRRNWGRYILLFAQFLCTLALVLADFTVVDLREKILVGPFLSLLLSTFLYFVSAMIVSFSGNIRRLTSRAWE